MAKYDFHINQNIAPGIDYLFKKSWLLYIDYYAILVQGIPIVTELVITFRSFQLRVNIYFLNRKNNYESIVTFENLKVD